MQSLNDVDESYHVLPLDYLPRPSDIDWYLIESTHVMLIIKLTCTFLIRTRKYSGDVMKLMQDKASGACTVPPEGVFDTSK